jgi:8-amino-7-oxononanoate synthase
MDDFTSALYLGMTHPHSSLRPWAQLTTGRPAALAPPPGARRVAQQLAALQGCERATLSPSTLHLFWDLFGILSRGDVAIYVDDGVYPLARWGIERAAARGTPVRSFPHHDADALRSQLRKDLLRHLRPLVVADGFCPGCGKPAPIAEYLKSVRAYGGLLILDDTQSLGIFGSSPSRDAPYGRGGGGMLRWSNVVGDDVLVVCSLAKGFGVPMASLSGSDVMIRHFEAESDTQTHCSPPSVAVIRAAEHALSVNSVSGDALRLRLAQRVCYFRHCLAQAGFSAIGGLFPVQTLASLSDLDVRRLHERLMRRGVRAVLQRNRAGHETRLSFIITARHGMEDIHRAVDALTMVRLQSGTKRSEVPFARHSAMLLLSSVDFCSFDHSRRR